MNEKDKLIKSIVVDVLDWLKYDEELFTLFFSNKISADKVYNRYLDEKKR